MTTMTAKAVRGQGHKGLSSHRSKVKVKGRRSRSQGQGQSYYGSSVPYRIAGDETHRRFHKHSIIVHTGTQEIIMETLVSVRV